MKAGGGDIRFPDGHPTAFQIDAVQRISDILRNHHVAFEEFRLNAGAFWTSFDLNGTEHTLAVYPAVLNMTAGDNLYENYLRREFASPNTLIESFARRLTRLLEDGVWELPEESARSAIRQVLGTLFRRRDR